MGAEHHGRGRRKGWDITHNTISGLRTSCGGGIGILIGDYNGGTVPGNLIAHNEIHGRVRVPRRDLGGYNAPGIVLFADWRRQGDTGATITGNRVTKNQVFISSGNPDLVTVSGVELSDTRDDSNDLGSPTTRSSTTTFGEWTCPWPSRRTNSRRRRTASSAT